MIEYGLLHHAEIFISTSSNFLWSNLMVWLLLGGGVFLSARLGFPQIRYFIYMWKTVLKSRQTKDGGISSFQALCTGTAAQVGTGNIAGVATAIVSGGPGAVFWLWMTGLLGMGTIFVEATLAQVFKVKQPDSTFKGGPSYYISEGLGLHKLGMVFSILLIITMAFVFCAVQSNSIANGFSGSFKFPPAIVGIFLVILTSVVIFGGIRRIASVAELVVPFMAAAYILVSLFIILKNITVIPQVFMLVVESAFGVKAVAGGLMGKTVMEAFRYGVARGLFSNEAGMGSTPNAHATASVNHPARQGFVAMTGVFINTFLICTSTAAIILVTGALDSGKTSVELAQAGALISLGSFGPAFISIALFFFAWTTILGNYYYGESNLYFIFPRMTKGALWFFRALVMSMVFLGTLTKVDIIWKLADLFNGMMAFINMTCIILLSSIAVKCLKDYEKKVKEGELDPEIDPNLIKSFKKVK